MNKSVSKFVAWSNNKQFGINISAYHVGKLISNCKVSKDNETGGILIGHYDKRHECAVITEITGPPNDSQSGTTWFYRGIKGLQHKLSNLWLKRRHYYIGEWHFHPHGAAIPSQSDINQMKMIAGSAKYHCPEPILVIIGERASQFEMKAYLFLRGNSTMGLMTNME